MRYNFKTDTLINWDPHMIDQDKDGNLVYDYRNVPETIVRSLPGFVRVKNLVAVR